MKVFLCITKQSVPECPNVTNAIDEVLLTAGSVEYFYRKLQLVGPLTDCPSSTYQEITTFTITIFHASKYH